MVISIHHYSPIPPCLNFSNVFSSRHLHYSSVVTLTIKRGEKSFCIIEKNPMSYVGAIGLFLSPLCMHLMNSSWNKKFFLSIKYWLEVFSLFTWSNENKGPTTFFTLCLPDRVRIRLEWLRFGLAYLKNKISLKKISECKIMGLGQRKIYNLNKHSNNILFMNRDEWPRSGI